MKKSATFLIAQKGEINMKKSEAFLIAQKAVLNDPFISTEEKLAILRILSQEEDWAKVLEEKTLEGDKKNG